MLDASKISFVLIIAALLDEDWFSVIFSVLSVLFFNRLTISIFSCFWDKNQWMLIKERKDVNDIKKDKKAVTPEAVKKQVKENKDVKKPEAVKK